MKLAIVGSRGLQMDLGSYIPSDVTEIISGGAKGIDACARDYAATHGIKLTEILPDYARYGRAAPIIRNREIVRSADHVLAFWDGASLGTKSVIDLCKAENVPLTVVQIDRDKPSSDEEGGTAKP